MSPPEITTRELLNDEKYAEAFEQALHVTNRVALNQLIPPYMHRSLVRYILLGESPGSFLTALLEGDLFAALAYADSTNIRILHQYGNFLYNNTPRACFGNPDNVQQWSKRGGDLGLEDPSL